VTAVDLDPASLAAIRANAQLNQVDVAEAGSLPEDWDVLLAADILYETGLRAQLAELAHPQRRILIADPLRHPQSAPPGTPLLELEARAIPDVDPPVRRISLRTLGSPLGGPPPRDSQS